MTSYMERAINVAAANLEEPQEAPAFDLSQFSLNGESSKMKEKMTQDRFILGRMAILGQSTVVYAKPNAGKTLLTIWLLIEAIKAGEIEPSHVFYVNADDNHKGLAYKLELAERYGFQMLAPGYHGFESKMLPAYIGQLVGTGQAMGRVLILDTVKKFTNLMDKGKSSGFGEVIRRFTMHGGSAIMLAHVNKNRNEEGGVVYAGTADLVDDADCAYTLDVVTEEPIGRTVKFENIKNRGDVALEAVYQYDHTEGKGYADRLASVRPVSEAEQRQAEQRRIMADKLEMNREAVEAIKQCLRQGERTQTELVKEIRESTGLSRQKVMRALRDHAGRDTHRHQYWLLEVRDKNAHVYRLNWGVGLEN